MCSYDLFIFVDLSNDIKSCLLESETCISLLLAKPNLAEISSNDASQQSIPPEPSCSHTDSDALEKSRLESDRNLTLTTDCYMDTKPADAKVDILSPESLEDSGEDSRSEMDVSLGKNEEGSRNSVNIMKTDNNEDIIKTLMDQVVLIDHKFTPVVKKWIEVRNFLNIIAMIAMSVISFC